MTQTFNPNVPVAGQPAQSDPIRENFRSLFSSNAGVTVPTYYVAGTLHYDEDHQELRVATTSSMIAGVSEDHFQTDFVEVTRSHSAKKKTDGDFSTTSTSFVRVPGLTVALYTRKNDRVLLLGNWFFSDNTSNADVYFDFSYDGVRLSTHANGIAGGSTPAAAEPYAAHPHLLVVMTQTGIHEFGVHMRVTGGTGTLRADGTNFVAYLEAVRI